MLRTPLDLIDSERYPLHALDSESGQAMVTTIQDELAEHGAASLPGFLRRDALEVMVREARELAPRAFGGPTSVSPYFFNYDIGGPDVDDDHPSRREGKRQLGQVAYDLIPEQSWLAQLYHSDLLTGLVAQIECNPALSRLADRYQSLNISVMEEGGCQQWHFDRGHLVTTLLLQAAQAGGTFEYVHHLRSEHDENFAEVSRVLDGERTRVRAIDIKPGTLNLFRGHYSMHRVSQVRGARPRLQTIFAFADAPRTHGSLKSSILHYGPRVTELEFKRHIG
jgi:hypothetical protein